MKTRTNKQRAVHFDAARGWDKSLDTRVGHQVRQAERRDERKSKKSSSA